MPVEYSPEFCEFLLAEADQKPFVEREGRPAHPVEGLLTGLSHLDQMHPAVVGVPPPGDEAAGVHRVEVVGEGRLPDPDRIREFPLAGQPPGLQGDQHQPDRL